MEKKKPARDLASKAGEALRTGEATRKTVRRLAARVLDSERNDPDPPAPKNKRKKT
jgi:hypothetical protein